MIHTNRQRPERWVRNLTVIAALLLAMLATPACDDGTLGSQYPKDVRKKIDDELVPTAELSPPVMVQVWVGYTPSDYATLNKVEAQVQMLGGTSHSVLINPWSPGPGPLSATILSNRLYDLASSDEVTRINPLRG